MSENATTATVADREQAQSHTLKVLFGSAIFGRAAMTLGFTVAAVLVEDMLGGSRWAGLSTVSITVGTAASAVLLTRYMNKRGRRPGLSMAYFVATLGGIIGLIGAQRSLVAVFLFGLTLIGVGAGGSNLARYAAADLAPSESKAKAISFIVFASTVGAVGGPTLVGLSDRLGQDAGLREDVGPYAFTVVLYLIGALILFIFLRPDPLVLSGGLDSATTPRRKGFMASLAMIWATPLARLALIALVISQAVMVGVMAMTPLHMKAHGHDSGVIGFVISAHTFGMFAFAPLAAWAASRFGHVRSISLGAVILIAATALTALAGDASRLLMFPGLYLLGLGWSFGMISGSALLTDSVREDQRVSAQGAADLVASIVSGTAALASGLVLDMAGFHILSMIGIVGAGLMLVSAFSQDRQSTLQLAG